ncbi:hypothetical protein [Tropicibacter naphthalenivorans]|uniref:Uncharacterized protein n=1 Tax=Tropicibacter naphthalenivorans TaxID=441103 RepID=A0A0P1H3L8_9RHOB|nr:hypothetical protein [Tropicibacter naphthalenivorans]CUH82510.1 hypothetical protein TRN7648_04052 [Tropicibacter naphthalenivorans]SMD06875.1 hypothetical protein SAMN04488093_1158 [Tropicibacter naphthalenivorans]
MTPTQMIIETLGPYETELTYGIVGLIVVLGIAADHSPWLRRKLRHKGRRIDNYSGSYDNDGFISWDYDSGDTND